MTKLKSWPLPTLVNMKKKPFDAVSLAAMHTKEL